MTKDFKYKPKSERDKVRLAEIKGTRYRKNKNSRALYRCTCGNIKDAMLANVNSGATRSCGCIRGQGSVKGKTNSPEYIAWTGMKARCNDKNGHFWHRYGGRGIKFCREWEEFAVFYRDMGDRPSASHTLDRIDNDKGYCKENCRWTDWGVQARNKSTNVYVEFMGVTMCREEWSRVFEIESQVLRYRNRIGWSIEKAFTTPVKNSNYRKLKKLEKELGF